MRPIELCARGCRQAPSAESQSKGFHLEHYASFRRVVLLFTNHESHFLRCAASPVALHIATQGKLRAATASTMGVHSFSGLLLPVFGACASLGRTLAFVVPSPCCLLAYPKHGTLHQQQRCAFNSSAARGRGAGRSVGLAMSDELAAAEASKTRNEEAEAKAAQLRAFAAELRAQVKH